MKLTRKEFLATSTALAGGMFASMANSTSALAATSEIKRLSGKTRYDTAAAINDEFAAKIAEREIDINIAIVASGSDFPDALAASALAGISDSPIILTEPNELSPQASTQLKAFKPNIVWIIGGTKAVSPTVEQQINNMVGYVYRFAGSDRYDTSLKILEQDQIWTGDENQKEPLWCDVVIIANGNNYPDALSISSFAYCAGAPIVLSNPESGLSSSAITAIKKFSFKKAIIVGGPKAVPGVVESQLKSVSSIGSNIKRIYGDTRFETSVKIADWLVNEGCAFTRSFKYSGEEALRFNWSEPVFATGNSFPDALAASPLAGLIGEPILLVADNNAQAINFAKEQSAKFSPNQDTFSYIVGGENAVSANIEAKIKAARQL